MWVTVTAMWTKMPELNKRASLQVGYESKEMYLIAITDAKTDVPDLTVETHHKLTRDRMLQKMKNASATQPLSLTIDGHPALQDEISGTEKGTNVVFFIPPWMMAIISNKSSHGHSNRDGKNRTNCCEITASFRSEK